MNHRGISKQWKWSWWRRFCQWVLQCFGFFSALGCVKDTNKLHLKTELSMFIILLGSQGRCPPGPARGTPRIVTTCSRRRYCTCVRCEQVEGLLSMVAKPRDHGDTPQFVVDALPCPCQVGGQPEGWGGSGEGPCLVPWANPPAASLASPGPPKQQVCSTRHWRGGKWGSRGRFP